MRSEFNIVFSACFRSEFLVISRAEQGVTINGVRYSHIVNPKTGSAVTNYDEVIVINDNGTYGDAFSTSMMFNTIEEIKQLEEKLNLKTIVIKDQQIIYKHEGIIFK